MLVLSMAAVLAPDVTVRAEPRAAMSALGSDVSTLPARYPHGDWVTIEAPVLSMTTPVAVVVVPQSATPTPKTAPPGAGAPAGSLAGSAADTPDAQAQGRQAVAVLDTGAMRTTLSRAMARRLALTVTGAQPSTQMLDAHGTVMSAERVVIPELRIGRRTWRNIDALVMGDDPELFLVGADVLESVDLFIAADEGLIGLFDPGQAPVKPDDDVVPLIRGERQLTVRGRARVHGGGREIAFPLIVDTGAWNTSVPLMAGVNGGLAADLSYEATSLAVGSEVTLRGRFVLDPLTLGSATQGVEVDRVLALGSTLSIPPFGKDVGLLGNDVLMRQHSVISFARGELRLRHSTSKPAERWTGPDNEACHDEEGARTPCIQVSLSARADLPSNPNDLPGVCLQVDVHKRYAGKTLELTITTARGALMNGGAIRTFVTADADGARACFMLWRQLEHLGINASTPLSLRWVRTEGVRWPCDPMKTRCITFTGPLARPAMR